MEETVPQQIERPGTPGGRKHGRQRTRAAASNFPFNLEMYGYLTLGLVLCAFIYFLGDPTQQLLSGPTSTAFPLQIPHPPLSPQLVAQDHHVPESAAKAPKPVTMSTTERT
jgi:hypothetical protein